MTNNDPHYDGLTRPLSLLDMVVLQYMTAPRLPTTGQLVALAECNASFRADVLALPEDDSDGDLCTVKGVCRTLTAAIAARHALREIHDDER